MRRSNIPFHPAHTVVFSLVLCGLSLAAPVGAQTIHIVNFDFTNTGIGGTHYDPTISLGDTVTWVWNQGFHSTTSVAGLSESWNSTPMAAAGQTFAHTFTHTGIFPYYCVIHGFDNGNGTAGGMSGRIIVRGAAVPEPGTLALLAGTVIPGAGLLLRRRLARVR